MRLFVGVFPPAEVRDHLAARVATLATFSTDVNTRRVPPERWHLTVAFLGDVPDDRTGVAVDAVGRVRVEPFPLRLTGAGRFGRGRFTTLWAGVAGRTDSLDRLARAVRRELRGERLPYDRKPLRPHLTLARPGDRVDRSVVDADLAALADYAGPQWTVDEVVVVRSHMGPQPRYEPLARTPLR